MTAWQIQELPFDKVIRAYKSWKGTKYFLCVASDITRNVLVITNTVQTTLWQNTATPIFYIPLALLRACVRILDPSVGLQTISVGPSLMGHEVDWQKLLHTIAGSQLIQQKSKKDDFGCCIMSHCVKPISTYNGSHPHKGSCCITRRYCGLLPVCLCLLPSAVLLCKLWQFGLSSLNERSIK